MPTCLITGTTHGIGLVTARELAAQGFEVVMACRNPARAELVRDHLVRVTGNHAVSVIDCDLARLDSVRSAARQFVEGHDELHLLINNAGMMTSRPERSADGYELTFACNHLGPFLLTRLVQPRLAAGARIVNVASKVHFRGVADFENLQPAQRFSGMRAYARSKLANVMFTLSLAERCPEITANCLHPGVVATNIINRTNAVLRWGMRVVGRFMLDDEHGAATTLYLATHPEVAGVTGKYFDEHQQITPAASLALDRSLRDALWRDSERLTGLATTATEPQ